MGIRFDEIIWNVSIRITKATVESPIKLYSFNVDKLNTKVFKRRKGGVYFR
jgi:hypothetical protein